MAQSPRDVFVNLPAALDYGARQTLFFGGDPAYAFTLPDGRIVHACGRGLAGLYRAIVWLQRDDIPKAKEMAMMLKAHIEDPNRIVAYIVKQVKEYAPAGNSIRTDLLSILESGDAPAARVDRFMTYMDGLMPVVSRQRYMEDSEYMWMRLRIAAELFSGNPTKEGLGAFSTILGNCLRMGLVNIISFSELLELIEKAAPLGGFNKYIISATIESTMSTYGIDGLTKERMLDWIAVCVENRKNLEASKIARALVAKHADELSADEVRHLVNSVFTHNVESACAVAALAVEGGVEGLESQDITAWMQRMIMGADPRWDLYARLALAAARRREVSGEQGGKRVLERQAFTDLSETEELRMVLGWIAELKKNGQYASAVALELELFRRQSDEERASGAGVTAAAIKADMTESFAKMKPLFAQVNYVARASDETAGKPAEPSEIEKLIDSAVVAVEILGDAELELGDILAWDKASDYKSGLLISAAIRRPSIARQLHIDRVSGFVTQSIAIGKERGMSGFLSQSARIAAAAVESDLPGATGAVALSWLDTIYSAGGASISAPLIRAIIQRRATLGVSDAQVLEKLDLLVQRKYYRTLLEVLREMVDQGMPVPEDSLKSWMTMFLDADPEAASAAADFAVAALQKKAIPAADETTVKIWGDKLVMRKRHAKALALGLAAQDSGIDIHEEDIQAWHTASYEGKTPEEAANNAIALLEVFRNRPAVRRMGLEQRQALEREIDEAFQKVRKNREELDSMACMPVSEAMGKIDAMIFGDG